MLDQKVFWLPRECEAMRNVVANAIDRLMARETVIVARLACQHRVDQQALADALNNCRLGSRTGEPVFWFMKDASALSPLTYYLTGAGRQVFGSSIK